MENSTFVSLVLKFGIQFNTSLNVSFFFKISLTDPILTAILKTSHYDIDLFIFLSPSLKFGPLVSLYLSSFIFYLSSFMLYVLFV